MSLVSVNSKTSLKTRIRAMSGDMEQALMETIAAQKSDTVKNIVVPWFISEMTETIFKEVI